MSVARTDETDDAYGHAVSDDDVLGEGGMRALQRIRDENRILRARIKFLEAVVMHSANMIVDAVEQTRGLSKS